jgi:hypothetical protein
VRRRKQSETGASTAEAGRSPPEEAATEVVGIEATRTCPSCGAEVGTGEQFCTACGVKLEASQGRPRAPAQGVGQQTFPPALPSPAVSEPAPERWRVFSVVSSRRALLALLAVLLVGALVAVALLAAAWQSESSGKHRAQRELTATRADLASARAQLAQTQATLASIRRTLSATQALSRRQGTILTQTSVVLRRVDPLLTDVDKLQQITGTIQSRRDTFTAAADQLVNDLIVLGNDLINESNSPYPDYSYINQIEIPNVNTEIGNVRSEAGSLANSDSDYSAASGTFGNDATGFTRAVRRLQRQLKALPRRSP